MKNDFQKWLMDQGYYRENGSGAWMKDGLIVSGKELNDKLNDWKIIYSPAFLSSIPKPPEPPKDRRWREGDEPPTLP